MNDIDFWKFAQQNINENKKVVLMIVADSSNSSPGRQGFKMLINENGLSKGTIGGGIMEKDLSEFAISFIKSDEKILIKQLQHSSSGKYESSGLICGGFQTILFINLSKEFLSAIEKIIESIANQNQILLVINNQNFFTTENKKNLSDISFEMNDDGTWKYEEIIGNQETVYIIGGGHVGKAVSDLMKMLGFYIVIFDHRQDIFTMTANNSADKKIICAYNEVGNFIKEGKNSFIVICTPKHTGDKDALASVINKQVKYIGMMGSKSKIKSVFSQIKDLGYSDDLLNRIHSPIGLEIYSETPAEIAVSIAAEIIKIKNEKKYV